MFSNFRKKEAARSSKSSPGHGKGRPCRKKGGEQAFLVRKEEGKDSLNTPTKEERGMRNGEKEERSSWSGKRECSKAREEAMKCAKKTGTIYWTSPGSPRP